MDNSDRSQTLEILDRYYAALKSGDREAIGNAVAEDIVIKYTAPPGLLPWAGEWRGQEDFFKFLDKVGENLEILEVNPLRTEEFNGGVFVILAAKWRVKHTGREVSATVANVFDIAEGVVTGYQVFSDTAAFGIGLEKLSK